MTIERHMKSARMSGAVVHDGTVYLSGVVPGDDSLDAAGQTRSVLARIDERLAAAGTDKSKLLSAQILMSDIEADFAAMNEVWEAWIDPENPPARMTTQGPLARASLRLEIMVIAAA